MTNYIKFCACRILCRNLNHGAVLLSCHLTAVLNLLEWVIYTVVNVKLIFRQCIGKLSTCCHSSQVFTIFAWLLSFDIFGMGDPTRSKSSSQHSPQVHWITQATLPRQGLVKRESYISWNTYCIKMRSFQNLFNEISWVS